MTEEKHMGSCLCGNVAIEAIGTPSSVAACHCQSCRKHTGAPVAVFVDYQENQIRFTKKRSTLYESSVGVYRGFCGICGSTISYQANNLPNMLHLHIGIFDTPHIFMPRANENIEKKLPWLCVSTTNVG